MSRRVSVWALLILTGLAGADRASAQTAQAGQLRVEVRNVSQEPVPGASVTLTHQARGVVRTAVTDARGTFAFTALPLGKYKVVVRFANFESASIVDNLVEADKTTSVPVVLSLAAISETVTVLGEVPIVDPRNQTQQTRLRAAEFDRMPYARSFLTLLGQAPGVVGTGNVNAHGALKSNNVFLIDGVDITDAAAGTFAGDIHFEAIEELVVRTSALSVDFGHGTGAVVDVITKSGTNHYQASYKFLATNDRWNEQNATVSQVAPFAALTRTRFDHLNSASSWTVSGPILRDRLWFFASRQDLDETSPERQTNAAPGFVPEEFQQTKASPYAALRVTAQLASGHHLWVKYDDAPTTGFVMDYFGAAAERRALTSQRQGGDVLASQYTAAFGSGWTGEVLVARVTNRIEATPFEPSTLSGGSPFLDLSNGRAYNGGALVGYVRRPRLQANAAVSYLASLGGRYHELKFGADWQDLRSESRLDFPGGSLFLVESFNPETRAFLPLVRQDYDSAPSSSTSQQLAMFARDRFAVGGRVSVDAGVRVERLTARSDVGVATVDSLAVAPRVSASAALTTDGKTLAVASFGRFHDTIRLQYSDAFSAVPQQTNYTDYVWSGAEYVFASRVEQSASTFLPDPGIRPRRMDEITVGLEQQLSRTFGASLRFIDRRWSRFIDDLIDFDATGAIVRTVQNVDTGARTYRGVEITLDRRWAGGWAASGSYTFSRVRGNHFVDDYSALGDFTTARCQQSADTGLGDAAGIFPCSEVQPNLTGRPAFDRPHLFKANAAFTKPIGRMDLTAGLVGSVASKLAYSRQRSVNVLLPGTDTPSGRTLTYFYEPRGSERVSGLVSSMDLLIEGAFHPMRSARLGLRGEIFNVLNAQSQIDANNTAWCNATTTAPCETAVATFGTATSRGAFMAPRTYRLSVVVEFQLR
jgi:hypothetical protein